MAVEERGVATTAAESARLGAMPPGELGQTRGEVLVTWVTGHERDPDGFGLLERAGLQLRFEPKLGARSAAELTDLLDGAVAAVVSTDPFDAGVFASCPALRVIARVGVGSDSIDLDAATDAGVVVTVTPGANTEAVADHTLALMLAALRRIVEHDSSVRAGEWSRGGPLMPWALSGKTVGLVGYGNIGRAVARRLVGFSVRILVSDPHIDSIEVGELVELDELLSEADIVTLHAPLGSETQELLGARELSLMRTGSVLVNTSRGGLIDEPCLLAALEAGRIRAAALDVFAQEPPTDSPLLSLPNVVLSPHIAGLSDDSVRLMVQQASRSVLAVLDGTIDPALVVNQAVLELGPSAVSPLAG